jgi:hypothetical protein
LSDGRPTVRHYERVEPGQKTCQRSLRDHWSQNWRRQYRMMMRKRVTVKMVLLVTDNLCVAKVLSHCHMVCKGLQDVTNALLSKNGVAWHLLLSILSYRSSRMMLIGPLMAQALRTLPATSYKFSHLLHSGKYTPNTRKHLQTSIFDSKHLSATLNVSKVFRNMSNILGRSHPTSLTFGHVSYTFHAPIRLSSNILDTCPQDSMQVAKEWGVSQYFMIYYNKGQFDLDIFSSYYIIIFWSYVSSHIIPYFLFDVDMFCLMFSSCLISLFGTFSLKTYISLYYLPTCTKSHQI